MAVRLNAFYEGSDTFRDFGQLERYGINPTVTLKPTTHQGQAQLRVFSRRAHRRSRQSLAIAASAAATRFNPTTPFAPNGDITVFFGSPSLNVALADVQTGMAFIEHDFRERIDGQERHASSPTTRNSTRTSIRPTARWRGGKSRPDRVQSRGLPARPIATTSSTRPISSTRPSPARRFTPSASAPSSAGRPASISAIPDVSERDRNTIVANPFAPTYFGPSLSSTTSVPCNGDGVTAADSNSKYGLNVKSAYARDTVEITRWLQLIGGVRFDRFDMSATRHEYQHQSGPGSTTWSRRRPP